MYSRITDRQCFSGSANCQRQSQTPRENWEWATREERKLLVRTMIQEVGCDVGSKRIMWVKVNPDYEILFRLMDGLQSDAGRRYWINEYSVEGDIGDIKEDLGQMATEVKIAFPVSGHRSSS